MTSQIDGGYTPENAATSYQNMVPYLGTVSGPTPTLTQSLTGAVAPYYVNTDEKPYQDNTYIAEVLAEFYQRMDYDAQIANKMQSNGFNFANAFTEVINDRTPLSKSVILSQIDSFFNSYSGTSPTNQLPTSIGEWAEQFVNFALNKLSSAVEPDYYLINNSYTDLPIVGGPFVPIQIGDSLNYLPGALEQLFKANLGVLDSTNANLLNQWTSGLSAPGVGQPSFPFLTGGASFGNTDGAPGALGIDNITNASTLIQGMIEDSFTAYINWIAPSVSTISLENFVNSANQFYGRLASVSTYFQVYSSFFLGASSAANSQAQQDLYGFIQNIVNDPAQDGFEASRDFGAWFTQVQESYIRSLNGVATLNQTALSESAAKTAIIQRIYALIVAMIGIIQKTTAAQADQLKVLTTLQGEMTNMISKAPILTSSEDNQLSNNTEASASTVRDELNQVVTAWTDTIRAQRDFQKSLAQSVQTNINTSNDAVSQQASMATALIQQQSTILSAIYR